jgi:hypothetical protein
MNISYWILYNRQSPLYYGRRRKPPNLGKRMLAKRGVSPGEYALLSAYMMDKVFLVFSSYAVSLAIIEPW